MRSLRRETKMFVPSQCGANLDGNLEEAVATSQQKRRRCSLRQQTGVRATSTNRFLGRLLQESGMGHKVGGQRTEKNQEAHTSPTNIPLHGAWCVCLSLGELFFSF